MIKNERQYRITKIQLAEFDATPAQIEQEPAAALPQLLQRVQADAIRSQRADLQAAVDDYETLQQHRPSVIEARRLTNCREHSLGHASPWALAKRI